MALGPLWFGRAFGTNTGNLFLRLEGQDSALSGTLHFNDAEFGIVVYSVSGSFDGTALFLTGQPETHKDGVALGSLTARARLDPKGQLEGEWKTDIGSAGTFILFQHSRMQASDSPEHVRDQLHTDRYNLGAIEIGREDIVELAEGLQREFTKGRVVITVVSGSEQARYLDDFKTHSFSEDRAEVLRIFVQEPEGGGINRVVSLEFGPQTNLAMTQGTSEAWVLGKLAKLKRDLRRFERTYANNIKRLGVGINQLLFVGAIVFLPSLTNLRDRAILMAGVIALMIAVDWLHRRYLPNAAIYLNRKRDGLLSRIAPSAVSWLIAATAGLAASLLAAYLLG